MTNDELDRARIKEAERLYSNHSWYAGGVLAILASLAREGWMPPENASLTAEVERLLGILKRVTLDPTWGEDPQVSAYYREARAALQPKEGEG